MKPRKNILVSGLSILTILLFVKASSDQYPKPEHFPNFAYATKRNPYDAQKVQLGRKLFYDPILSANYTISCASCHSPFNAFAHTDHDLSHGIHDSIGHRNATPLFNLAWSTSFGWDGAVHQLDAQALAPINDHKEMGLSSKTALERLQQDTVYARLFADAFHSKTISTRMMLQALAQFMLTLVSDNAKYDQVLRGEAHFTQQEANGYMLFKQYCNTCHTEPLFTNFQFKANGIPLDTTLLDLGRYAVTKKTTDSLAFKVPSLRNLSYTYPYMHDGRFNKLKEVIHHYSTINTEKTPLASELSNPIRLTPDEKVDILSFLLTLDDKDFCFNTNHNFPR